MDPAARNTEEVEEWIVTSLQDRSVPAESFIEVIAVIGKNGRLDKADACADIVREAMAARGESDAVLRIVAAQAAWHSGEKDFAEKCENTLSAMYKDAPESSRFISHAGFDKKITPDECLRRFRTLVQLVPGAPCYDKTWGFGVVRDLDEHVHKVTIDFTKKPRHKMSFAYAGESLRILPESHVLARHYREPEGFARMMEDDPAGVVKSFITDFGPMNIVILQEMITENLETLKDWKQFWSRARKDLKKDPLVMLPAKRNEPIRVVETKASFDNHWMETLRAERDSLRILSLIEDFRNSVGQASIPDALRAVMADRITFAADGANGRNLERIIIAARALLLASEMELAVPEALKDALVERLQDPKTLLATMHKLPARSLNRLAPFLASHRPGIFEKRLLELMPRLTFQDMNVVIESLIALGCEAEVVSKLREMSITGSAGVEVVSWFCTHTDFVFKSGIATPDKLVFMAQTAMEAGHFADERIQARNKIRSCFQKDEWLKDLAGRMSDMQRRDLMVHLKASSAWQESERNMVLARLIQIFPELRSENHENAAATVRRRVTSLRSYAERQAALSKLVEVDIPKNIQDIAVARSFGDLSENYEYHAARETQGMLMARRKELENDLAQVAGVSFDDAPCDRAGEGTLVVLRRENGAPERRAILGEWDHDEKFGIISSSSALAKLLTGKKTGDELTIPGETGEVRCVIAEVSPLPDEIRNWISSGTGE